MKRFVKKFAVVALAVLVFSMLAGYAYATTSFASISMYTAGGSYATVSKSIEKDDATPSVVLLNNSGFASQYRVRILGCEKGGSNPVNYTYYNDSPANYVVCNTGKTYGVDNWVFENEFGYASLSVMPLGGNGTTTGQWSPDSFTYKTYTVPESAG